MDSQEETILERNGQRFVVRSSQVAVRTTIFVQSYIFLDEGLGDCNKFIGACTTSQLPDKNLTSIYFSITNCVYHELKTSVLKGDPGVEKVIAVYLEASK